MRWLWHHELLRTMAIVLGLFNAAASITFSVYVLFAQEILGASTAEFAAIMMAGAAGAIVGGWTASWLSKLLGSGRSLAVALGGSAAIEVIIGLMSNVPVVAAMNLLSGLLAVLWNVITVSLRQSIVPDQLLGRVNSVYRFLAWGMIPLGAIAGGLIVAVTERVADRELALRMPWFVAGAIEVALLLYAAPRLTTQRMDAARTAVPSRRTVASAREVRDRLRQHRTVRRAGRCRSLRQGRRGQRLRVAVDGRARRRPGRLRVDVPVQRRRKDARAGGLPIPDPLIWLAYVAAATERIRLATGILILPQRNPVVLAKELATLDHLSGGRIILGIGIGWLAEEFAAIGVPFAERAARTDDHVAALRALWSDDPTHHGEFTQFTDCIVSPRPAAGSIPIHVGGHSEAAARRAGRLGDGYFPVSRGSYTRARRAVRARPLDGRGVRAVIRRRSR